MAFYSELDPRLVTVVKTADEIVNNSDVVQNDDHLFFNVAPNSVYQVDINLIIVSTAVADFRVGLIYPVLTTAQWHFIGYWSAPQLTGLNQTAITSGACLGGIYDLKTLRCIVQTGANAGSFGIRWAQQAVEVSDTTVKIGSNIVAIKVS
jgi:hypothetical protein